MYTFGKHHGRKTRLLERMILATRTILAIIVAAAFSRCIDPYDYHFEEKSHYLVVEGYVTTQPGPHLIKLTSTRNIYNKENQYKLYIESADVSVVDEEGTAARFRESTPGLYYSDSSFVAQPGKKYKLRIVGFGGRTYESTEEEVFPASEINMVNVVYAEKKTVSERGFIRDIKGFNVSAFISDDPDVRNQYLMRVNLTYLMLTNPAPKPCCEMCWIGERLPDFEVFKDQFINGQLNVQVPIAFFPTRPKYFYDRVYVEAEQLSLSPAAYTFWRSLYEIKNLQGGLFDPVPAGLAGNISNVDNKTEPVIGYFFVSDVAKKGVFVDREILPDRVHLTTLNIDCRELPNSTDIRPPFWN